MTYSYTSQCHQITIVPYIEGDNEWMCQNVIQCTKNKNEILVFGPKDQKLKVNAYIDSIKLKPTNQARND